MKQIGSLVLVSALAAALCLPVTPALAGIADTPLPVLEAGKRTYHVYSVPGIVNNGPLTTFFSCTSTDTATMRVGVEAFNFAGGSASNDPVASSVSVLPGGTVTLACSAAVSISISSNIVCGPISRGSARILATSKKLTCTAYIADPGNVPPTSAWQLTIVKQKTQKGD